MQYIYCKEHRVYKRSIYTAKKVLMESHAKEINKLIIKAHGKVMGRKNYSIEVEIMAADLARDISDKVKDKNIYGQLKDVKEKIKIAAARGDYKTYIANLYAYTESLLRDKGYIVNEYNNGEYEISW